MPLITIADARARVEQLAKGGGPYIGKRGGKWADAKHTIPWKADKKKRSKVAKVKPEQLPDRKPLWPPDSRDGYSREEQEALLTWVSDDFPMVRADSAGEPQHEAKTLIGMIKAWEKPEQGFGLRPERELHRGMRLPTAMLAGVLKASTFTDDMISSWTSRHTLAKQFAEGLGEDEDGVKSFTAVIFTVKSRRGMDIDTEVLKDGDVTYEKNAARIWEHGEGEADVGTEGFAGEAGESIMAPGSSFRITGHKKSRRTKIVHIELEET